MWSHLLLPSLRKQQLRDGRWLQPLLQDSRAVVRRLSDIAHVGTRLAAAGTGQLWSALVQLFREDIFDNLLLSLEELGATLTSALPGSPVAENLRIVVSGIRGLKVLQRHHVFDIKYQLKDLFSNTTALYPLLESELGLTYSQVESLLAAEVNLTSSEYVQVRTGQAVQEFLCDPHKVSRVISTELNQELLSSLLCSDRTLLRSSPRLLSELALSHIFNKVSRLGAEGVLAQAGLDWAQARSSLSLLQTAPVVAPRIQRHVGALLEALDPDTMENILRLNISTEGLRLLASEFFFLTWNDVIVRRTEWCLDAAPQALNAAGKILCGKPLRALQNEFKLLQVSPKNSSPKLDSREITVLPSKFSSTCEFCRAGYEQVMRMAGGPLVWGFLKPVLRGKILFAPNNIKTQSIMAKINSTFDGLSDFLNVLQAWSEGAHGIQYLEQRQYMLEKIKELAGDDAIRPLVEQFIGKETGDLLHSFNVPDMGHQLGNMSGLLNLVQMVGNMSRCFDLSRFQGHNTEQELVREATRLNQHREFVAAVVFLNLDDDGSDSLPAHVRYKIRMDIDNVPSTLRTKSKFWRPGPRDNFLEDLRYFRGFVQLQELVDTAIQGLQTEDSPRPSTYLQQFPYPCYRKDDKSKLSFLVGLEDHAITISSEATYAIYVFFVDHQIRGVTGDPLVILHQTLQRWQRRHIHYISVLTRRCASRFGYFLKSTLPILYAVGWIFVVAFLIRERVLERELRLEDVSTFVCFTSLPPFSNAVNHCECWTICPKLFSFIFCRTSSINLPVHSMYSTCVQLLGVMGLSPGVNLTAWFLSGTANILVGVSLITVILTVGGIFPFSNPVIVALFLLLYSFYLLMFWYVLFSTCSCSGMFCSLPAHVLVCSVLYLLMFCYLMSVLFKTATLASLTALILYLISSVPFIMMLTLEGNISFHQKLASLCRLHELCLMQCLVLATSFCFGSTYLTRFEDQGVGIQWDNIWLSQTPGDPMCFAWVMIMMMVGSVLYFLVGWYISNFVNNGGIVKTKKHNVDREEQAGFAPTEEKTLSPMDCESSQSGQVDVMAGVTHLKTKMVLVDARPVDPGALRRRRTPPGAGVARLGNSNIYGSATRRWTHRRYASRQDAHHLVTDSLGISIRHLQVVYRGGTSRPAVSDLSLDLRDGQVTTLLGQNGAGKTTTMHGVLSVLQIVENGHEVIFDKKGCHIYDNDHNLMIRAEKRGRLYLVRTAPSRFPESGECSNSIAQTNNFRKFPLNLWHQRLMHINYDTIVDMMKREVVIGLNCQAGKPDKCSDCMIGKSTKRPFLNLRSTKETQTLALVHCDLLGPFNIESWGGSRFVLTIIDDASRYTRVYFLKRKGDTLEKFKEWMKEAENQTGFSLKRIRTDNGLEFCSSPWDIFTKAHGIVHERTMVYTPEQNGVAERMNRTLLNLVRSTVNSCNLPTASWAELTNTAAYLRNRVTNRHNEEKTPFELWFGKRPALQHLRAIGCETFVHVPKQRRNSKLQPRATKGILVGYSLQGRGWRIWIPEKRQVVESRNCVFKEEILYKQPKRERDTLPSVHFSSKEASFQEESNADQPVDRETEELIGTTGGIDQLSETLPENLRSHPMTLRSHGKTAESPEEDNSGGQINATSAEGNNPTYEEAMNSPEVANWIEAIEEERESLERHDVWQLQELPKVSFKKSEDGSMTLSQSNYIEELLQRFRLQDAKGVSTPMETNLDLSVRKNGNSNERFPYRELIGGLSYLSQRTRPDIAYAVGILSRYCDNYTREHWEAGKRVLRYLKGTKDFGITYRSTGKPLIAFSDASWASDIVDRKGVSGHLIILAGAPIIWRSTKQTVTALSTMESEYIALSSAVKDITWVRNLMEQLKMSNLICGETKVFCDNQAAISHAENYIDKSKTRHFAVKYHFVREKISEEAIELFYTPSAENPADFLTKPLARSQHEKYCRALMDYRNKRPAEVFPGGDMLDTCQRCHSRWQNVHDDERSGSPVTATDNAAVAAVRNVVEADRRVTIDEIIIRLPPGIEIRRSSIGTIMSDVLDFRKVCARWVARLLLENHKQQRMEAARIFLEMHQRDGDQLFSRIVTGDESWVHHSTPETKRQSMVWKKPKESAPKKAKVTIYAGKVMGMENFKWEIFTHPPHSPELAPSDFHLYPALKWHLGGKHFANDDEVQAEANHWLRRQDTSCNVLTGQLLPTSGAVSIYGRMIPEQLPEARKLIGYCPQYNTLFSQMTMREHLRFYGSLKGILTKEILEKEIDEMLESMGLQDRQHELACHLSGGLQRRLCVALAFIGGSKLIVLDEPTSSVDPVARRAIWDLILKYRHGRTILLTTHHMDEADLLSDNVAIVHQGRILCSGSPLLLKHRFGCGYQLSLSRQGSDVDSDSGHASSSASTASIHYKDCGSESAISFIQNLIPNALVLEEHSSELVVSLPQRAADGKPHHFSAFFRSLDDALPALGFTSYGLSSTTLEEVSTRHIQIYQTRY
ncbi:hypothetical protein LAZ67_1002950 [Cordylochernes scorpioides]|uniref:Integrase catalytic domain-containing protein n=1 Tax=Cordylochernes scorpioides TaxID=51811 RepID=A0ABY6JWH3_9ARAC|nr:hypothetical protein LAZ67_1002950 [Cordylochernes scorpioides]